MIKVEDLEKAYGSVIALKGVSFEIAEGEIVGLLGPNGAGKTTIIKSLTGYIQPDAGSVSVNHLNVLTHQLEVQSQIGYLPENAPLYPELNIQSYLKMIADIRNIPRDEQLERISETVVAVGVQDLLTRPIGHLSKGYRQRVGLAQAILHKPRFLILDEPTIGLDPTQIVEIRKLIKRLSKNSTVLFSTHILPEVEALCDRVIILMNGEVKADARLDDLASTANGVIVLDNRVSDAEKSIRALPGVSRVEAFQDNEGHPAYRIICDNKTDINPDVFKLAASNNWPVRELRRDTRTLEAIFNDLAVLQGAA